MGIATRVTAVEPSMSADGKGLSVLPGPLPPTDVRGGDVNMEADGVVKNYLRRTQEERKRFPPVWYPGFTGKKKVAICGLASTTRHQAPFKDMEYDIWTMHEGITLLERVDMALEPHDPMFAGMDTSPDGGPAIPVWEPAYKEHLAQTKIPMMMHDHYPEFPTSIKCPFMELVQQFGRFQTTSVTWLMALAIRNGYEQIDLWGVEMEHGTEYTYQAKGVVYFIGVAEGRGIQVGLPRSCQLMKNRYLYGLETKQQDEVIQRIDRHQAELSDHKAQVEAQLAGAQQEFQRTVGRIEGCEQIRRRILLAE